MQVTLPTDISEWQSELTRWQREALVEAARGTYAQYSQSHSPFDRLNVVRTDYGFDILGLRRVSAFDSNGVDIPDAWALAWVVEVHPTVINHGDFEGKYIDTRAHSIQRGRPYTNRARYGMATDRTIRRRCRRGRRRERRERERMRAELARLVEEQEDWIGHPSTFPDYDRIHQLQELLSDSR